jgi:hypothetical protein
MGYRSDIVIAVTKEAALKYETLLNKFDWVNKCASNRIVANNGDVYWFIYGVKWYENSKECIDLYNTFRLIDDEEDESMAYGFMRHGEDSFDEETRGQPDLFEIYSTRSIETPVGNI